ncbi:MAG TPA: hypothetical protein PKX93_06575, partial [bacterium]|nr:hypothetical protein [bacterium]
RIVNQGRFQGTVADVGDTRHAPRAAAVGKRPEKSIRDAIPYSAVSPARQVANEFVPAADWVRSLVGNEIVWAEIFRKLDIFSVYLVYLIIPQLKNRDRILLSEAQAIGEA